MKNKKTIKILLSLILLQCLAVIKLEASDWYSPPYEFKEDAFQVGLLGEFKKTNLNGGGTTGFNVPSMATVDVTTGQLRYVQTIVDAGGNGNDLPLMYQRALTPKGWRSNHDIYLYIISMGTVMTRVIIIDGYGSEMRWDAPGLLTLGCYFYPQSKAAMLSKFEYTEDGWVWKKPNGLTFYFDHFIGHISADGNPAPNTLAYKVSRIKDRHGNEILYQYGDGTVTIDGQGRTLTLNDSGGSHFTLSFSGKTWMIEDGKVTDPMGYITEVQTVNYNDDGIIVPYITRITDANGHSYQMTYTIAGSDYLVKRRISQITAPDGSVTRFEYPNEDLTQVIDARGVTAEYRMNDPQNVWMVGYDPVEVWTFDRIVWERKVLFPDGSDLHEQFQYDEYENVSGYEDISGNHWQFERDKWGNLLEIHDPEGNTQTFEYDYDKFHQLIRKVDALGRETTYQLDSHGNPNYEFDALGQRTLRAFSWGNVVSKTDRRGFRWRYGYNSGGDLTSETNPLGQQTFYTYDAYGNRTSMTDALGRKTYYDYDENNRLTRVTYPDGRTQTCDYDPNGNKISEMDENGNKTVHTYDLLNRLIKSVNPLGGVQQIQYDALGNVIAKTDAGGNTTVFAYDPMNRLTAQTDPMGFTTTYSYGWNCGSESFEGVKYQPTETTDPRGITTSFHFDKIYRLRFKQYFDDTSEEHGYDAAGNQTALSNRAAVFTYFIYDDLNRLVEKQEPEGRVTRFEYDAEGNLLRQTDPMGNATEYSYDALGRITQVNDPEGGSVTYAYDAVGNRTTITNQNGHMTTYTYDSRNRLTQVKDPLGRLTKTAYDGKGNLASKTFPNGYTIQYAYDKLDRLTQETYPDAFKITYAYDVVGNRIQMRDRTGTTSYTYDKNDRLTKTVDPSGRALQYQYDSVGNRTLMTDHQGLTTRYAYDELGQLIRLTDPSLTLTTFQYDVIGRRTKTTYPNGTYEECWYDWANRLRDKKLTNGSGTLLRWIAYQYDANDNRIQMDDIGLDGKTDYAYDSLNRITEVQYPDSAWARYAYDKAGNRTKELTNTNTITYQYNAANQLTQKDDTLGARINYTYNANGNLTKKEDYKNSVPEKTTTYTWDYDNLLASYKIVKGTSTSTGSFSYDGDGRQTKAVRGSDVTKYFYDGLNILYDLTNAGSVRARYVTELGLDEMIERVAGGVTQYYHSDGLGSVTTLTNTTGAWTARYRYDAWGNERVVDGVSSGNTYTYTSRRKDTDLGLLYYRARYYDPTIGRFISQDAYTRGPDDPRVSYENNLFAAIHGEATLYTAFLKPHEFNRYIYCSDNPVRFTDPLGLDAQEVADKIDKKVDNFLDRHATKSVAINTAMEMGGMIVKGTVDVMRFGEGIGEAVYGDGDALDKTAAVCRDIARAASLGAFVGSFLNKPYNRYVGAESKPAFDANGKVNKGTWLTRDNYSKMSEAKSKLQLPYSPTSMQKVKVPWFRYVAGPGKVSPLDKPEWGKGGGRQYRVGGWED